MNGWIANTHPGWFDFLAQRRHWPEVNFWSPSDYYTFRGEPGTPYFFRLLAPRNMIGGFGFVQRFTKLPEWLAWECFGVANGSPTLEDMTRRLAELREKSNIQGSGTMKQIGCLILSDAVFLPRHEWIPQPSDWPRYNMRYKGYPLTDGEGKRIWEACLAAAVELRAIDPTRPVDAPAERYGTPVLVAPRLGQGGFRVAVTDAYARACAVTGEHSLPALEAAHIRPFAKEGPHATSNGLLLRSDLHRLFDKGYVTVTPDFRLEVSRRLKQDFDNGRSYYPLHGQQVTVPSTATDRPDPGQLAWHNESVFLG